MRIVNTGDSRESKCGEFIDVKSATLVLSVEDAEKLIDSLNEFIKRFDIFKNGGHVHVNPLREESYDAADLVLLKDQNPVKKCPHLRWIAKDNDDSPVAKCAECGETHEDWQWFCPSPDSPNGLCDYTKHGEDQCAYCGDPDERK